MKWPYNYTDEFIRRQDMLQKISSSADLKKGCLEYYRTRPVEFIEDWCVTYDPRNVGTDLPPIMPFLLFDKQKEFVDCLVFSLTNKEHTLVEKSRDMGISWICVCVSVWLWLFWDGSAVGFGSRKEEYVDKIGDPKSIFEKIRIVLDYLPSFFLPKGLNRKTHCSYMKIINPATGANITGEAGDNIGRGGRTLIYFKDESAHYERPEKIEAALGDNTNVQIDVSSVNGTANVFYRKRMAGEIWTRKTEPQKGRLNVFIADWSDHPAKTQEWYDLRRNQAEREGLLHVFAQEVDRDYASAVEGVIIAAKHVKAAIDAHVKLGIEEDGQTYAALDVADEGGDKNALGIRKGVIMKFQESWAEGDTGQTARKAVAGCIEWKATELHYDCIGVGAGVKSDTNRMIEEGLLPDWLEIIKWNASKGPLFPDENLIPGDSESPLNKDFYESLKSQGWWKLRQRFEKTYNAVVNGEEYPHDELISIPSNLPEKDQLVNELSQVTYSRSGKGKIVINKKPSGTKSPNLADQCMMLYWPVQKPGFFV